MAAPVPGSRKAMRAEINTEFNEKSNKTESTNKIHNFNEYPTSSDLILLIRSICLLLGSFLCNTMPVTPFSTGAYGSHFQHTFLWKSLSACVRYVVVFN